ncbi:META domain-containing protein [Micromonospora sp. A202]|uniref:META domain-containing protein n=1 Tax=Micromonospora sp. A202 TaxID=2572899 RepID=UPI00163987A4|nr:META domain-containing protein [Micromonospora sp. A202]
MGVLLSGCAMQGHPEAADTTPPATGTTGAAVPLVPEMLIGSWTLVDVADTGVGKILRLADSELHLIGSHCGTLGGSWRANDEGVFLADVWSASTVVVGSTPGCEKASQGTPGWLRSVTAYQFDGAGLPVLLDGRGQAVARLIPGATPTPEPDKVDSVLEPPVVTDEARRALAPAVALPATLVPADQRQPIGRWAPESGHKAAHLEFTADGEWHGSDGCNDQSGRWITASGGALLATARAATLAFCADSVPIEQWVTTARRAGFDGKDLVLLNAHGDETGRLSPTN